MSDNFRIHHLIGDSILPYIKEIARLRIEVFHEFPYLYDGNMEYEKKYLQTYIQNKMGFLVLAIAKSDNKKDRVIGASTGVPMESETTEIQSAFIDYGLNPREYFYFGESVLEKSYRGLGIGNEFFNAREAFARSIGYTKTCFCSVIRPIDHPLKPQNYRPLDEFWNKRGYKKHPNLIVNFSWKDRDKIFADNKSLVFWIKEDN